MKRGFKAFSVDFSCRGFQYQEGENYSMGGDIAPCSRGFHYCENPFDVLDYYDLCESEFAEIEDNGNTKTDGDKSATNNITIKTKLGLSGFVNNCVEYLIKETKIAKLASSGYSAKLASSGDSAQLASSGDYAKLASSGYSAKLASSGDSAQLASSGDSAKLASSGYSAKLASSGDSAKLASSGYSAKLASSGYSAKLASSGDSAQLASSGDSAQLASSGDYAKLASSGYSAKLASSGDSAKLASSGYSAKLEANGQNSVVASIGYQGKARGVIGTWLTLAEYDWRRKVIKVQSRKIDGKRIKANTWYSLINKKFTEV